MAFLSQQLRISRSRLLLPCVLSILFLALSSCANHQSSRLPLITPSDTLKLRHAEALILAGGLDSARGVLAAMRDDIGDDPQILTGLARIALAQREWNSALRFAKDGLRGDSGNIWLHYIAAVAAREAGVFLQEMNAYWHVSRDHFEWVLRRDSLFHDVLGEYATLERYCGSPDHALQLARAQIRRAPNDPSGIMVLYKLFRYYMATVSPAEFTAMVRPLPGEWSRFFEGEVRRRSGDLVGADSVFTRLLEHPGEVSPQAVRLARARLLMTKGLPEDAEREYMKGLQELEGEFGAAILFDDLKYIISDTELSAYESLSTTRARIEFIRTFWNFRNPSLALPSNGRLQEHIQRYLTAEERYEFYGFRTWFTAPDNELVFPRASALNEEFNDMGLVYLRHGRPDDITRHGYSVFDTDDGSEGEDRFANYFMRPLADEFESWLYDARGDAPRLILHFQKFRSSRNYWRLTGQPAARAMLANLTLWDHRYSMQLKARTPAEAAGLESELRTEARDVVRHALATEEAHREERSLRIAFPHAVDMFRGAGEGTLLDISYAVPIATLARSLPDTLRNVPVEVGFSMIDARSEHRVSELDTVVIDLRKRRTGALVDLIRYTVPPDSYAVSMHLRPLVGSILGTWKQVLRVRDFSKAGLSMSSIQLLRPSPQPGALEIDGVKVIQSPFATHIRTEPFFLYFQIYDLIPNGDGTTSYTTDCRLVARGDKAWEDGIVIHAKQKVGRERTVSEFYKIDLATIKPGRYTLVVRVTDRMRFASTAALRVVELVTP